MGLKLHAKMFKVAEATSNVSEFPRIQIGAVIARKNNIIAVGVNQTKSHPLQKKYNQNRFDDKHDTCQHHLHAEMDAISKVKNPEDFERATIYVYRKNLNGELAMSKPCEACMTKIIETGIKKIGYTTNQGFAIEYIRV